MRTVSGPEALRRTPGQTDPILLIRKVYARLGLIRSAPTRYHIWHYNSHLWEETKWMGVTTLKSPSDMWNYQEILFALQPSLIVEFGTRYGGSALFFASVMRQIGNRFRLLSVDIDADTVSPKTRQDPDIDLLTMSSTDPRVAARIESLRKEYPGPVFAILDSDHSKDHVLDEMKLLRPVLRTDDYLIVEDSNVNGHPVYPSHGPGPFEAIEQYVREFPGDYTRDTEREGKFGFTWAPNGFLIRR
jgi:cephalosporin hydroxylase